VLEIAKVKLNSSKYSIIIISVVLNIVLILMAFAVTMFTIAASALSCKALCCQNKTEGPHLNQAGLYHLFTIC
jgi:hypothetical protein